MHLRKRITKRLITKRSTTASKSQRISLKPRRRKRTSLRKGLNKRTPFTKKIGYVIPSGDLSGGISVVCQHANRLRQRGLDVVLITMNNIPIINWFPNLNVPILPFQAVKHKRFHALIATHWTTAYQIKTMKAKRKYYFVQSVESRFYQEGSTEYHQVLQSYQLPYQYLTEALWIQRWLKEHFNHHAIYVPNGIDEAIFHPTPPIEHKGNRVRVLLEGPVDVPMKGMADAFEVVKDLDCEVWCVSRTGLLQPEWRCDRFFTQVPMLHMKHIYSSCDILLKLSQVEGFFGPPMEMMACGGTAVVGNCTGHDEYIVDGYNALVVPLGNLEHAKQVLNRLIHDHGLRMQLSLNGKQTAAQWRWDQTIETLRHTYR